MGKQTAIALTLEDERAFLRYLRSIAAVKLIVSLGPNVESLWVESFDVIEGHATVYIWNTSFAWAPEYGAVTADPSGERNGYRFISNSNTAPLLEYSRHNFENPDSYGRVYWGKYFSGMPAYDVRIFGNWYSAVVRWLRRNGRQAQKDALNTYYLPDAWEKHGKKRGAAK